MGTFGLAVVLAKWKLSCVACSATWEGAVEASVVAGVAAEPEVAPGADACTAPVPLIALKPVVTAVCAGLFCVLKLSTVGPTFDVLPFGSHSQKYVPTRAALLAWPQAWKKA